MTFDGPAPASPGLPPAGTRERWAWDYVHATTLAEKLASGAAAAEAEWEERLTGGRSPIRRIVTPGRPPELRVKERADKTRGLRAPSGRARALHTFFHHELQAAELMAWAMLAFPEAPIEFREGLHRIARDEIRHMAMYAEQIARLGYGIGDFAVRDWFWLRVPSCPDPAAFVAVMGLGLESANLEHTASFAARFREAGDEEGARVQEIVGLEEIAHVRFGVRWFERLTGAALRFDAWSAALPAPLSPMLMRGRPLRRDARKRAGQSDPFLDELEAWQPTFDAPAPGS